MKFIITLLANIVANDFLLSFQKFIKPKLMEEFLQNMTCIAFNYIDTNLDIIFVLKSKFVIQGINQISYTIRKIVRFSFA